MSGAQRIGWKDAPSSRWLGGMLLGTFIATILLFLSASVVSNYRERGTIAAAQDLSDVVMPSIQHLSGARTALRQAEVSLDDLTDGVDSDHPGDERMRELTHARETLHEEWRSYEVLPLYPGEGALQETANEALSAVDVSLDRALADLRAGAEQRAREERNTHTAPALERLDVALSALLHLNADRGADKSADIAAFRRGAAIEGVSLHVFGAMFALAAGVLVVRVVRRYARVMDLRVSELERFAGRVAHDIRSPLNAVGMALDLSKTDPEVGERVAARLDRAYRSVQRIGQLVDGLLVFAVSGAPPTEGARAEITPVLTGILDEMAPRADEKEIELESDLSEPCAIACTPGVLTSLLVNLIGNAIKYMGDASVRRVVVRAKTRGGFVRVEVEDTGPGVPAELRARIFDPYVRAATSSETGLGLGLATVRRLVEAHGGSVGVEAGASGGSLFWFELPCAADHGPAK